MKKLFVLMAMVVFLVVGWVGTSYAEGWTVSMNKDEMTGKLSAYAMSSEVSPTRQMGFPYSDVKAYIVVGCKMSTIPSIYIGEEDPSSRSEWVYVYFTTSPNLLYTKTEDGYNRINIRVKWDDGIIEDENLVQEWGSKYLHFRDGEYVIHNICASNTLLLGLEWHGQGSVYFRFDLSGSSKAINEARGLIKD